MGNKQEMVVAVRAPEGKQGPINVTMTTDVAQDLFLHWGIRKQGGGDWVAPPKVELMPLQRILLAVCLYRHLYILDLWVRLGQAGPHQRHKRSPEPILPLGRLQAAGQR